MLDLVMIVLMFVFTAVTLLWIAACDHLMRTDSTLAEAGHTEHWSGAPAGAAPVESQRRTAA